MTHGFTELPENTGYIEYANESIKDSETGEFIDAELYRLIEEARAKRDSVQLIPDDPNVWRKPDALDRLAAETQTEFEKLATSPAE